MKQGYLFVTVLVLIMGCDRVSPEENLEVWLSQQSGVIREVISQPATYRPQVLFTSISHDSLGAPTFLTQSFRVDAGEYFYPASTVKLPVAVFALEKCRDLGISPEAIMHTDSTQPWQTPVRMDTSAESGQPSVAHYIRKIFLVSDNDAFNRLYEFVGPAYIHRRMNELGLPQTRIVHRLSIALSRWQNQILNPIHFLSENRDTLLSLPERKDSLPPAIHPSPLLGKGEIKAGKLVNQPKNFSEKNDFPIREQQEFLTYVIFFNNVIGPNLKLNPSDRDFLLRYMSMLPYESDWPRYDRHVHYDSYVKFFLFGDSTDPMPEHIRIYNKVGNAYGWLIDNAWIVNEETGEQYLLTACIWVNDNRIFNDDEYEYDEIGYPFLGELGRGLVKW